MTTRKPVPVLIYWLTAVSGLAPVVVVAAMAATLFGGADISLTYDLITWSLGRGLAFLGLASAMGVCVLAFRDIKRRGVFALVALLLSCGSVGAFVFHAQRLATPSAQDVSTNVDEPPAFTRAARLHPSAASVQGASACPAARSIPTQVLAQQAVSALVDAGFPVVRASTFEVEGVHEDAWFGFAYDAVVRIRPGRTDIRVSARDARPDGGATCRLMGKVVAALEAEVN